MTTRELKQTLFNAYGGFADKRIKNIDKGTFFIIDDRTPADEDASGRLFLWFCLIFAEVIDQDTVNITMRGGVPDEPLVKKWLAENGGRLTNLNLQFVIRRGEEMRLAELATAFRSIVRPGARYAVRSTPREERVKI